MRECNVTVKLSMTDNSHVHIEYSGEVCHPVGNKYSPPFRQGQRQLLHRVFQYGCKPSKLRAQKMREKSGEQLLAGNFDEIGASDNVLSKISSESHQVGRLDKDVYTSLQKCKEKFAGE